VLEAASLLIRAIGGGPPFHPNCVHVLTPFVEPLATEEERKVGMSGPKALNRTPGESQRGHRRGFAQLSADPGRASPLTLPCVAFIIAMPP